MIFVRSAGQVSSRNWTFSLSSYPHIKIGDVVTYEVSGNKDITAAGNLTWSTSNISDQSSANQTADLNWRHPAEPRGRGQTAPLLVRVTTASDMKVLLGEHRLSTPIDFI